MGHILRLFITIAISSVFLGCHKDGSMDAGGPISRYLGGRWKLDKIVTPSQTKVGTQIGYTEIIDTDSDQVDELDKVYHDSTLIATYTWSRNPWPVAKSSNMTVLVTYTNGYKRFFKIRQDLMNTTLETSGYLTQIGTAQDSIKYYYSRAQ